MAQQPESRLQARIQRALNKEVGGFWFKIWAGPFQRAGLPDIIGCTEGCFFGFEVKTQTGKPTKLQLHTLQLIRDAGGCAEIVRTPQQAVDYVTDWLDAR